VTFTAWAVITAAVVWLAYEVGHGVGWKKGLKDGQRIAEIRLKGERYEGFYDR